MITIADQKYNEENFPFHYIASNGTIDDNYLRSQLETKREKLDIADEHGWYPIHVAAFYNAHVLFDLLYSDSRLRLKDNFGMTSLHHAAFTDAVDIFKICEKKSIKVNFEICDNERMNLLHHAALGNSHNVIIFLKTYGKLITNILMSKNRQRQTPIDLAIKKDSDKFLETLIDERLWKDYHQYHYVHATAANNSLRVARLLIDKGIDVAIPNRSGKTAFHYIEENNSKEMEIIFQNALQENANKRPYSGRFFYNIFDGLRERLNMPMIEVNGRKYNNLKEASEEIGESMTYIEKLLEDDDTYHARKLNFMETFLPWLSSQAIPFIALSIPKWVIILGLSYCAGVATLYTYNTYFKDRNALTRVEVVESTKDREKMSIGDESIYHSYPP